jgi:hypothetical protein
MTPTKNRLFLSVRRLALPAMAAASSLLLASCGSIAPSASHPDASSWGQSQRAGWTTSPQVREAEEKSIARDMPYASVTASGQIVQK